MMVLLIQFCLLLFLGVTAAAVVFTRRPRDQTIGLSFYGILLAMVFFAYQAPAVALSQIVVGAVTLPMLVMLGLAEVRRHQREQKRQQEREQRA